jgi:hypothetical protein
MIDLTPIILAIIALVFIGIGTALIPYLKTKKSSEELQTMWRWVQVAVGCAEQLAKTGVIDKEERKAKALKILNAHGYTADLDAVDQMIESAVSALPSLSTSTKEVQEMIQEEVYKALNESTDDDE